MKKSWFRIFQNLHIKQKISPYHQNWAMCKVFPATTHLTWYQNPHVFCSASFSEDSFAACVEKKHCRFLTSVCWSLDCSHHMRAVLCDGLNRKLMLSQRCLLHYSNCLYGSGCRSLKDTSSCTYRGSCDGRHRFYFHWGGEIIIKWNEWYCTTPIYIKCDVKIRVLLTFDLWVIPILQWFCFAHNLVFWCARIGCSEARNGSHWDCRDLVHHMECLHDGLLGGGGRDWCSHGVAHRFEALWELPLDGDQHGLTGDWRTCERSSINLSSTPVVVKNKLLYRLQLEQNCIISSNHKVMHYIKRFSTPDIGQSW